MEDTSQLPSSSSSSHPSHSSDFSPPPPETSSSSPSSSSSSSLSSSMTGGPSVSLPSASATSSSYLPHYIATPHRDLLPSPGSGEDGGQPSVPTAYYTSNSNLPTASSDNFAGVSYTPTSSDPHLQAALPHEENSLPASNHSGAKRKVGEENRGGEGDEKEEKSKKVKMMTSDMGGSSETHAGRSRDRENGAGGEGTEEEKEKKEEDQDEDHEDEEEEEGMNPDSSEEVTTTEWKIRGVLGSEELLTNRDEDVLLMLQEKEPAILDEVCRYYLHTVGCATTDRTVARLVSVAVQLALERVIDDAKLFYFCRKVATEDFHQQQLRSDTQKASSGGPAG
ncbi:transcription initiation factor tfiid 23-30 kda subunit, partial [Cystoisospora suis]